MSLLESKLKDLLSVDNVENIDESIYQGILKQEMPEEDTSKISNIFLHVDLKEVTAEKVNFVYNFFQKNERVSEVNTDLIININGNFITDAEVENKLRQIPRYNSISWKKPVGAEQEIIDVDLKDINILKETIISNKEFIKINLKDEVANELLYKNLETSLLINQSYENKDSALDLANKTIEIASDRAGLTGQSKKILIENFTNSKPIGLTFANTDYRSGNQNLSNVIDDNINFNLTINRKLTESIVKLGSNLQENIFQNEFKVMIPAAENITKKYIENYQNSVVENNSETEFMLIIDENYLYDNKIVGNEEIEIEIQTNINEFIASLIEKFQPNNFLFIDYGYLQKNRSKRNYTSLLRTYKNHHLAGEPIENFGNVDITYDINFSALEKFFSENGYKVTLSKQKEFLEECGALALLKKLQKLFLKSEGIEQLKIKDKILGVNTILDPNGLGGFYVLRAKKV